MSDKECRVLEGEKDTSEKEVLEGEKDTSEKQVLKEGSEAHQFAEKQAEVKNDSNTRQADCGKWRGCGACEV
jgi:hypothetical protein